MTGLYIYYIYNKPAPFPVSIYKILSISQVTFFISYIIHNKRWFINIHSRQLFTQLKSYLIILLFQMLKHVQISPHRNRADSLSLRSSTSCSSSLCGSPEPPSDHQRTPSRASSYSSLNEQISQVYI